MKITFFRRVMAAVGAEVDEENGFTREQVSLFDAEPPVQAQPL